MKFLLIAEQKGFPSTDDFTAMLLDRWPGATVKQIVDPARRYALEFSIPAPLSFLEGMLDRTGTSIAFEGDLRNLSEFTQWCRSLVPSHLPLLFCDEGLSGQVRVTPSMTAQEILQAFHGSGG